MTLDSEDQRQGLLACIHGAVPQLVRGADAKSLEGLSRLVELAEAVASAKIESNAG